MFRLRHHDWIVRSAAAAARKRPRPKRVSKRREFFVEQLEQRCMLALTVPAYHSDAGASKTIYLDFNGQVISNNAWIPSGSGQAISQPFDLDNDPTTFSDDELDTIQLIFERVKEDFLPFDVDVTTEDPGVEALKHTTGGDTKWGQRVVIGGSASDWYTAVIGGTNPLAANPNGPSFYTTVGASDNDTMAFVFTDDLAANPNAGSTDLDKLFGEAVSHVVGTTLGLQDAGVLVDDPNSTNVPPDKIRAAYGGHGAGETSWESIMGTVFKNNIKTDPNDGQIPGFDKELTQWSKGEYQLAGMPPAPADPKEDQLAKITAAQTGVSYRTDDHGNTIATADPLQVDTNGDDTDSFSADGIIERNTDVDYFSFTVDGATELIQLDILPAEIGANLDILATLYDSAGNVIATSNPADLLAAGAETSTEVDGGWLDPNGQLITNANDELELAQGTYYLAIRGTGKAPQAGDQGYSNYGSLGAYSITATRKRDLVVGVDFDVTGGPSPENWNPYTGGTQPFTMTDLINEAGLDVPYTLTISSNITSATINTSASPNGIDPNDVPAHGNPLDDLGGYISGQGQTASFVWGNLTANTVYQIYVFGHSETAAKNQVNITGGLWYGATQTYSFTQNILSSTVGSEAWNSRDLKSRPH